MVPSRRFQGTTLDRREEGGTAHRGPRHRHEGGEGGGSWDLLPRFPRRGLCEDPTRALPLIVSTRRSGPPSRPGASCGDLALVRRCTPSTRVFHTLLHR